MVQFFWQDDLASVAKFLEISRECVDVMLAAGSDDRN